MGTSGVVAPGVSWRLTWSARLGSVRTGSLFAARALPVIEPLRSLTAVGERGCVNPRPAAFVSELGRVRRVFIGETDAEVIATGGGEAARLLPSRLLMAVAAELPC